MLAALLPVPAFSSPPFPLQLQLPPAAVSLSPFYMDQESHNVTTITILDVSLSLVHIPRSRLIELNRPVLKQILRKRPKFLNLTANEIELSIFAENDELLADFEPISRRDRQKQRLRESASGTPGHRHRRSPHSHDPADTVEISMEKWKVLQIDAHDDSLSNSGSRVRELSAPLAAAGISILYQSSYLSDFIFVKASRLPEVINILGDEGFTLYNTNPCDIFSSPLPTAIADLGSEGQFAQLRDRDSRPSSPSTTSPAVFSRMRSPSVVSLAALSNAMSKSSTVEDLTSTLTMHRTKTSGSPMSSSATSRASRTPKKSTSPTAAPVDVLSPDLACVGLNEGSADVWSVKLITLVGYPELIPTPDIDTASASSNVPYDERRNSLAESLYGAAPNVLHRDTPSPVAGPLSPSAVFSHVPEDSDTQKDSESVTFRSGSPDSLSSCSSSDPDEYFSSSSPYNRTRAGSDSTPSLASTTSRSSVRSLPERLDETRNYARPRLNEILTERLSLPSAEQVKPSRPRRESESKPARTLPLRVPFFSFTRTEEGSSLTTDIRVLSALFGLDERYMLICSGTLLDVGDELNVRAAVERQLEAKNETRVFNLERVDLEGDEPVPGTMKCLQIDLKRFGLDKYGLVNRFSRVLEENGINHMYSSTFKTANLLVDKVNAGRAQALLRSC